MSTFPVILKWVLNAVEWDGIYLKYKNSKGRIVISRLFIYPFTWIHHEWHIAWFCTVPVYVLLLNFRIIDVNCRIDTFWFNFRTFSLLFSVNSNKPVPVFPWHALVPFLTNTGPPTVTQTPASTFEQPIEKQHQNIKTTASPKKASQSEHCVSVSEARKFKNSIFKRMVNSSVQYKINQRCATIRLISFSLFCCNKK